MRDERVVAGEKPCRPYADTLQVKPGDVVTVRGCCWSDDWEFDAPLVIYAPIKRYEFCGSISPGSIERAAENLGIDLCLGGVRKSFHDYDLLEFAARGWSPRGFRRRKRAVHAAFGLSFYEDTDGTLSFEMEPVPG